MADSLGYKQVQDEGKPADMFIRLRVGMQLQISCIRYEVVAIVDSGGAIGAVKRGDVLLRPVSIGSDVQ